MSEAPVKDIAFLMQRYFPGQALPMQQESDSDRYLPRKEIAALYGFRLWSAEDLPGLLHRASNVESFTVKAPATMRCMVIAASTDARGTARPSASVRLVKP